MVRYYSETKCSEFFSYGTQRVFIEFILYLLENTDLPLLMVRALTVDGQS